MKRKQSRKKARKKRKKRRPRAQKKIPGLWPLIKDLWNARKKKGTKKDPKKISVTYKTVAEAKRIAAGTNKDGIYKASRKGRTVTFSKR